jgi:hypothetical protein
MNSRFPFDPSALRQRLAALGIHPEKYPADFEFSAEIVGLTPAALGHDLCAQVLRFMHHVAADQVGGEYAVMMTRDPVTHVRRGYAVYVHDHQDAAEIAGRVREVLS